MTQTIQRTPPATFRYPAPFRYAALAKQTLANSTRVTPNILGYLVEPGKVLILLSKRTRAPVGFQELDDGFSWLFSKETMKAGNSVLPAGLPDWSSVAGDKGPMLIWAGSPSAGQSTGQSVAEPNIPSKAELLLDLEQLTHISLKGRTDKVMQAMKSFAMDLLGDHKRADLKVYFVGFGHEFEMFPQVKVCDRLSDVPEVAGAPDIPRKPDLPRKIVFDPFSEAPERLIGSADLSLLSRYGTSDCSIEVLDQKTVIHPYDIELDRKHERSAKDLPYAVFKETLPIHDEQDRQLQAAQGHEGSPSVSGLAAVSKLTRMPRFPRAPLFKKRVVQRQVKLKILGPTEMVGAAPFATQQCADFVCYLAFHREGVTPEMIRETLWSPHRAPNLKTVVSLVSRTRAALGTNSRDKFYIPKAGSTNTYKLSAEITTDYDDFCRHLRSARTDGPAAIVHLRRALRLVRGVPFCGPPTVRYRWADVSVRAHIECLIDDAAHRLADIALWHGDCDTARWACYQAHKVVPGCEQCYLRRFKAARLSENLSELRSTMAEIQQVIRTEEGFSVSHNLSQIYQEFTEELSAA